VNLCTDGNKHVTKNVTALMYAIEHELVAVLRAMLPATSTNTTAYARTVSAVDSHGNSALHYAAMKTSSQMADVIQLLLANGLACRIHEHVA
jgi:ankyrin repeat protein